MQEEEPLGNTQEMRGTFLDVWILHPIIIVMSEMNNGISDTQEGKCQMIVSLNQWISLLNSTLQRTPLINVPLSVGQSRSSTCTLILYNLPG